jgi:predicted phage terminase large subunit-like protein
MDSTPYTKQTVVEWLNGVNYAEDLAYIPDPFALEFVNFIKLVNGATGEEHTTPVAHLKMLDNVHGPDPKIINMCSRGLAKALAVGTLIMTPTGVCPIEQLEVGDHVIDRDGLPTKVTHTSDIFTNQTYKFILADGSEFIANEDHIHILQRRTVKPDHTKGKLPSGKYPKNNIWKEENITTLGLLEKGAFYNRVTTDRNPNSKEQKWFLPLINKPVEYSSVGFPIDPYITGIILGDGNVDKTCGTPTIVSHKDDINELRGYFSTYTLGDTYWDKRNPDTGSFRIKGIAGLVKQYIGTNTSYTKHIPPQLLYGTVAERIGVLRGLMDTDGTISPAGHSTFCSASIALAEGVRDIVKSLGGHARISRHSNDYAGYCLVSISLPDINPFLLQRKAIRWVSGKMFKSGVRTGIKDIIKMPLGIKSKCISVDSPTHSYLIEGSIVTHNTTLMGEYLFLYIAVYGEIPNFGAIDLALYVSDSIENGIKNMRKNLEFRWENSEFLQAYVPTIKFTDIRWEFVNADGRHFVVKGYGAKALSLDSILYGASGETTIGSCLVGDRIYGPNGRLTTITKKSEIFYKPMYRLSLSDGRSIKVSEDHINSVVINTNPNNTVRFKDFDLTTTELLQQPLTHTKKGNLGHRGTSSKALVFVKNTEPLIYRKKNLPIDPYTLGVVLGDGRIQKPSCSVELTTHIDDLPTYSEHIPYAFGKGIFDKRNPKTWTQSIRGLGPMLRALNLGVHGNKKFIPEEYFRGSVGQRLALLQGLMDTDGTVTKSGRTSFCSVSPQLLTDVMRLARSLGATANTCKKPFNTEIWLNMPMFRLPRKLSRQRHDRKSLLVAVISIERIEDEPSQCIAVDNDEHQFLTDNYFRTHNTGVRGAKEMGKRPQLAVLDDLISDEDARSDTVIASIEATVNKAVNFALHPTFSKTIWSGTPFNARDPLYKAVESGAWKVNVYPICNQFPCTVEDFKGAWESRFPYSYVNDQYNFSMAQGKIADFNQELMLRIMSEEDRLIEDGDILWYDRSKLLQNKQRFNFYITTDFATSDKQSADFSVIAVWALNNKGFWFLVDGICKRQTMDKNVEDLFRLAQIYSPQSVGIEISGQQGGFIPWVQAQMLERNSFFNLATDTTGNSPGIRPNTNKMVRFNVVVPWFKSHLMFFPKELQNTPFIQEYISELSLVSVAGFKSKNDDCIDTVSMLASLTVWRPSEESKMHKVANDMWEIDDETLDEGALSSYVV